MAGASLEAALSALGLELRGTLAEYERAADGLDAVRAAYTRTRAEFQEELARSRRRRRSDRGRLGRNGSSELLAVHQHRV